MQVNTLSQTTKPPKLHLVRCNAQNIEVKSCPIIGDPVKIFKNCLWKSVFCLLDFNIYIRFKALWVLAITLQAGNLSETAARTSGSSQTTSSRESAWLFFSEISALEKSKHGRRWLGGGQELDWESSEGGENWKERESSESRDQNSEHAWPGWFLVLFPGFSDFNVHDRQGKWRSGKRSGVGDPKPRLVNACKCIFTWAYSIVYLLTFLLIFGGSYSVLGGLRNYFLRLKEIYTGCYLLWATVSVSVGKLSGSRLPEDKEKVRERRSTEGGRNAMEHVVSVMPRARAENSLWLSPPNPGSCLMA